MTRVLVVDDEPQLLRALGINLRARHYEVHAAATGAEALQEAAAHPPDVVILDLGLPDMDGTEVIAGLRGWTDVPILVLSGRTDSIDKVEALDAGADDYVTKPFGMDELLARLRAMTRRTQPQGRAGRSSTVGEVTVDLAARRVVRDGHDVRLTPTEWHLLEVLVRHPGKLLSQRQLLHGGLGTRVRDRAGEPAALHGPAAPQARTRPVPPSPPAQRTRAWATASSRDPVRHTPPNLVNAPHRRLLGENNLYSVRAGGRGRRAGRAASGRSGRDAPHRSGLGHQLGHYDARLTRIRGSITRPFEREPRVLTTARPA